MSVEEVIGKLSDAVDAADAASKAAKEAGFRELHEKIEGAWCDLDDALTSLKEGAT